MTQSRVHLKEMTTPGSAIRMFEAAVLEFIPERLRSPPWQAWYISSRPRSPAC
jgi:hypothetical protein